jgi:protein-disulfide isomerase
MPKEPRQRHRDSEKSGDTLTRNLVLGMVALVVLSGVVFTVLDKRQASLSDFDVALEKIDASQNGPELTGTVSKEDDYGISFNLDTKPKVEIWEDPQCPFCNDFEKAIGSYVTDLIRNKEAQVTYRMTSFLGQDSVRAVNASFCSVTEGRFLDLHRALFAVQGQEGSGTYANENLLALSKKIGINSPDFEKCVKEGKYLDQVKAVYDSMAKYNVKGTPTVFINGKLWERSGAEFKLDEFKSAIEAAKQQ